MFDGSPGSGAEPLGLLRDATRGRDAASEARYTLPCPDDLRRGFKDRTMAAVGPASGESRVSMSVAPRRPALGMPRAAATGGRCGSGGLLLF